MGKMPWFNVSDITVETNDVPIGSEISIRDTGRFFMNVDEE